MACRRLAPMRLVPFSYFCTCWKVTPRSLASAVWLRPSSRRLTRTREPTRTSVCVGPCFIWQFLSAPGVHAASVLYYLLATCHPLSALHPYLLRGLIVAAAARRIPSGKTSHWINGIVDNRF